MGRFGNLKTLEEFLEPIEEDAGFCAVCGIRYPDHIATCPQSHLQHPSGDERITELHESVESLAKMIHSMAEHLAQQGGPYYGARMEGVCTRQLQKIKERLKRLKPN